MLYISDAEHCDRLHESIVFVDERQAYCKISVSDFLLNSI